MTALSVSDPEQLLCEYWNFASHGLTGMIRTDSGTGAGPSYSPNKAMRISKGTAAAGICTVLGAPNLGAAYPRTFPAGATEKFFIAARFAIGLPAAPVTLGPVTEVGVGMTDAAAALFDLLMGCNGAVHTTNFSLMGTAGAGINSGVTIDNAYHDHLAWRDGTNTFYQVDANAAVSGSARNNVAAAMGLISYDGPTNTVQYTVDPVDWFHAVVRP
jgi:hypothetical protein